MVSSTLQRRFHLVILHNNAPSPCNLQVPSAPLTREELRVGLPDSGVDVWTEGQFLIFDDSFEQEIWVVNPSVPQGVIDQSKAVLLLSVDVWHPNLKQTDRDALGPLPF